MSDSKGWVEIPGEVGVAIADKITPLHAMTARNGTDAIICSRQSTGYKSSQIVTPLT